MIEEVDALERTAEWRRRKGNAEAAALLERLAAEVRAPGDSPVAREYMAICNWLGESGEIADFMDMAQDYRARIGVDAMPADGEAYLQALVAMAKHSFGAA